MANLHNFINLEEARRLLANNVDANILADWQANAGNLSNLVHLGHLTKETYKEIEDLLHVSHPRRYCSLDCPDCKNNNLK